MYQLRNTRTGEKYPVSYFEAEEKAQALASQTGDVIVLMDGERDKDSYIPGNVSSEPHSAYVITGSIGTFEKTVEANRRSQAYSAAAGLLRQGAKQVVINHDGTYRAYGSAKELDKMAEAAAQEEAQADKNAAVGSLIALGLAGLFAVGTAVYDRVKR
jgi:hypothetical protein